MMQLAFQVGTNPPKKTVEEFNKIVFNFSNKTKQHVLNYSTEDGEFIY